MENYQRQVASFQRWIHTDSELVTRTGLSSPSAASSFSTISAVVSTSRSIKEEAQFQEKLAEHVKNIFACFIRAFSPETALTIVTYGIYPFLLETWVERNLSEPAREFYQQIDIEVFRYVWEYLLKHPQTSSITVIGHPYENYEIHMYATVRNQVLKDGKNLCRNVIYIVLRPSKSCGCCTIL